MSGFAASPGDRGRPDVLDPKRFRPERVADPLGLAFVEARPLRVVLGEVDGRVVLAKVADRRGADLLVRQRRREVGVVCHEW